MGFGDSKERRDSKLNEAPNETLALLTSGTEPQKSFAGLSQKHGLLENNNQEREPSQSSNPQQVHTQKKKKMQTETKAGGKAFIISFTY